MNAQDEQHATGRPEVARPGLTSVQIGIERIAYLDVLSDHFKHQSRAEALFSAWLDVAAQGDTLMPARRRPARAPLPVSLRPFWRSGIPTPICQLSGPGWTEYGQQAQALSKSLKVPLSQLCRDVIDAHADRHAHDLVWL